MKTIRRIGTAVAVAVLAVSVLGSSPANAKDTSWSAKGEKEKIVRVISIQSDTSWG